MSTLRLLINLPPTFFTQAELQPYYERLGTFATLRQTSHDTQEQLAPDLSWAEAVFMWAWPDLDDALLDQAPDLRFVGQINTHRITAETCLKRGIALSETRHCWSPAVAEMALTLMLAGLRQTSAYHAAMRQGTETWVDAFPTDINPLERSLTGRPVGIVGFGGIGQRLAELLQPFKTPLFVHDPFLPSHIAESYGARMVPLMKLIESSDVVVLCAANTREAAHLMGKTEIDTLRSNCVLVNVGRSMLVDMVALQARLAQGNLIAMLDVFDQEPLEADSPLRTLPNTYLTPHRAGGILESVERAFDMLTSDLEAFLNGDERQYAVTESMLKTSFSG